MRMFELFQRCHGFHVDRVDRILSRGPTYVLG